MFGFVDGSHPCPLATLLQPNADLATIIPNPDHVLWLIQDQLLLNAIVGSVSSTFVQFISTSTTSRAAWVTLEKTYASSTQGQIMTHQQNLANPQQGNKTITEDMQDVKRNIDALALMNIPVDFDELFIRVLNGLGLAYVNISHTLYVRNTPVTFEELFE